MEVRRPLQGLEMRARTFLYPWLLMTALYLCLACPAPARASVHDDWWDEAWAHRLEVSVVPAERRSGLNTARLNLAEQSLLCAPDGRDVRVVAAGGTTVAHRVVVRDNKTLDVLFMTPDDCSVFRVYYGNEDAPAAEGTWDESLGGLVLETRPLQRPIGSPRDLARVARQNAEPYDRKPWPQIWDLENPFGPDDMYLSIYEGTIFCPETGDYQFAINADDLAVLSLPGLVEFLCWRNPGVPGAAWEDPQNPQAVRRLALQKGVYRISYLHAENTGAQLAKLGWRLPSSDAIQMVPPEAFTRYLPVDVLGRQEREEEFSPFFVAEHLYNLRVNGVGAGFPVFRLRSCPMPGEAAPDCSWDLGDGTTADGPQVEHEFPALRPFQVTLRATDASGRSARVTRPITAPALPVREMSVELQVEVLSPVIPHASALVLNVRVAAQGGAERVFQLSFDRDGSSEGPPGTDQVQDVRLDPAGELMTDEWSDIRLVQPGEGREKRVALSVGLHGVEVAREEVAVLGTNGVLSGLHLDAAQALRMRDGALAALRLARSGGPLEAPRRIAEMRPGTVRLLVFDDMLAGPPGTSGGEGFAEALAAMLKARYPALDFRLTRSAVETGQEPSPLDRFLHLLDAMGPARPTLVLLVCQPATVVNAAPLEDFRRCLTACIDQVQARSRAQVVVVTPPPMPGRPDAARPYARAAKQVGIQKDVPVVDLYSRFVLTSGWEDLFRSEGADAPAFLLYPNPRGQMLIARELYDTIVARFHDDLSTAARQESIRSASQ
jgi:hypothetical protein